MSTRNRLLWTGLCLSTLLFLAGTAQAQEMLAQPVKEKAATEMK